MAKLEYLILHCSATPPNMEVTKAHIEQWHLVERGWSKVGYSKLFQRSGNVIDFVEVDNDQWITPEEITNGAAGFNSKSVHWCFAGGLDKHGGELFGYPDLILTPAQMINFRHELNDFLKYHGDVKVIGHNQVSSKKCPGFKVSDLLKIYDIPANFITDKKLA